MERQPMTMEDPILMASSVHSATASLTVTPSGMACTAELFLSLNGTTKAATSGHVSFTSSGGQQSITLSVTMPSVGGSYGVYLDIEAGGYLLAAYQATENVIIPTVSLPVIVWA